MSNIWVFYQNNGNLYHLYEVEISSYYTMQYHYDFLKYDKFIHNEIYSNLAMVKC